MDDLIEKVARAIFDPFGAYFSNGIDDEDWHNARDMCRAQARAAIDVVRMPVTAPDEDSHIVSGQTSGTP